ncbi:MAG: transcriptional regulator, partial [Erythrobacter sp.]
MRQESERSDKQSQEGLMQDLDADMKETLITLTSDIVAAHVSNNDVAV